jgi:ferrous iron transport protein B
VVSTVATQNIGVGALIASLDQARVPTLLLDYGPVIEPALAAIAGLLPARQPGQRGRALLLLEGDPALEQDLGLDAAAQVTLRHIRAAAQAGAAGSLGAVITHRRWQAIAALMADVYVATPDRTLAWRDRLGRWAIHPVAGWPILALVLFAVYKFVGEFGAGTLVNLVEKGIFGQWIIPGATGLLDRVAPVPLLHDALVGPYGLLSVGLAYGLGIVLPIVSTFFLTFGLLEDSGYLPRLAVLVNRGFHVIGLNGKAVLPLVLGLGCVTMATMTTRILSTRRERLLATLLLALSIPCSAQLGVILGLVSMLSPSAVGVWLALMTAVLLGVGWLAARVLPGESADFIMELPPLRRPQLTNIVVKTLARLEWYLKEVIPLFLLATFALFVLDAIGLLRQIEQIGSPLVVDWLGLPPQTAGIFLVGFLRRDYGAAGLFQMVQAGLLTPHQVLVSLVVITLFVPCIATVMMLVKEQGVRPALGITAFVFPFAFLVGGIVHRLVGG